MNEPIPSKVEYYFLNKTVKNFMPLSAEHIPVLTVSNYVTLGKLAALRFIEWVIENPEGIVALPTGKTPEYFIKWFHYYVNNWTKECNTGILAEIGIKSGPFPSCKGLTFVQIDEFYPFNPNHERSFNYYVRKYYIEGFGFDKSKALLIDTNTIPERLISSVPANIKNLEELFGGEPVDFSLRFRHSSSEHEELQQKIIRYFDSYCQKYEEKIRSLGGIGFFLGGIGPDGHVGFNVRGSGHFSVTRLTRLNYESTAAAATDLGGIESVNKKAVITIGLGTITFNPNAVAVIFAAGQSKANVIASAVRNLPETDYPATSLQKLANARMYITESAASDLIERKHENLRQAKVCKTSTLEKLIIKGAIESKTSFQTIVENKISSKIPAFWELACELSGKPLSNLAESVKESLLKKVNNGIQIAHDSQNILHTAPHHDDIELAYFPLIHHLVRSSSNRNHFCYLTSGFTSVTNSYVLARLETAISVLKKGYIGEITGTDRRQYEIQGYLNAIASQNREKQDLFTSTRLIRNICEYLNSASLDTAEKFLEIQIKTVRELPCGAIDPEALKQIKSRIREWEADTVWAHFGLNSENVYHMRLKFYTGDIFPDSPHFSRDVIPVADLLEKIMPTVITLALDPEGSGPDTHYKCLMALRAAISLYAEKYPEVNLKIWGYRNVWSRFSPEEVSSIIPVSLNSFAVLHNMFDTCFVSQKSASFPSYEFNGTFSRLAQKIWVEQFDNLIMLLGKDCFYKSPDPIMRRAFGAIYLKEMSVKEFMEETSAIEILEKDKIPLNENIKNY
jgi:glucosamine-6-phosphate deaminase